MQRFPLKQVEIAGPSAIFVRPDSGSTPVSYPAPTYSAAKGIIEAVLYKPEVKVHPTRVAICRPLTTQRYTTNYGGPLRKANLIKSGNNYQLIAEILVDVCYRIEADILADDHDSAVKFAAMFDRRLSNGQNFRHPCLGWSEFLPSYFGPLRQETQIEPINMQIPSMLHTVWQDQQFRPEYRPVNIQEGVLAYAS